MPSHFFKIVLRERADGEVEALAIVLPHRNQRIAGARREPYMRQHLVTIAAIERATGLTFLPAMEAARRARLRDAVASEFWPRN